MQPLICTILHYKGSYTPHTDDRHSFAELTFISVSSLSARTTPIQSEISNHRDRPRAACLVGAEAFCTCILIVASM
jgi:hypothetical protein